jgi:crotonobetainyl-CoA:carnitine CoA-transferase CaiB-like acyl-CoA transferase
VQNRAELIALLEDTLVTKDKAEWKDILDAASVPNGPINTIPEVFADPQLAARDMIVEMEHPVAGTIKLTGSPLKLSASPVEMRLAPPLHGEQSAAILHELGYTDEQIQTLRDHKVI